MYRQVPVKCLQCNASNNEGKGANARVAYIVFGLWNVVQNKIAFYFSAIVDNCLVCCKGA